MNEDGENKGCQSVVDHIMHIFGCVMVSSDYYGANCSTDNKIPDFSELYMFQIIVNICLLLH
jgi:hypothetical protein